MAHHRLGSHAPRDDLGRQKQQGQQTPNWATVRQRLAEGMGVVIFPEGTTYRGPDLLEYRPGMFYTCAEEGFPIVPVALEYRDPDIAWVDKAWFIPHAFHHFGAKHMDIALRFGPVMRGEDAETLRSEVMVWTQNACLELRAKLDHQAA